MNAHTPFDANQDWTNPYCQNSSNDPMVDALLGNAYHVVRTVYCNLGNLKLIYDFLNQYGMVLGVQSEVELKALTTKASFARIYDKTPAGDRQVTDYLYVEGDRTGILPDETTATGSWVKVATSGTGGSGGESSNGGGYIPWVYNSGSANGGETTIRIPDETAGAPFMIVNGDWQTEGYDFEYDPLTFEIKFTTPLEQGDFVVVMRTGVPATPDSPNVSDWVTINWLYNQGAAVGGEQVIDIPYTFQSVPAVYKNGLRFYKGLTNNSYTIDSDNNRIILTEPLATNDRLIVQLGGEANVLEIVDHTVQEVARAANVKDSEVILSTDTTQVLNNKTIIFDVASQSIYGLPTLPTNVYIKSVSNGVLVYNPGSVSVNLVNLDEKFINNIYTELSASTGSSKIGYTQQGSSLVKNLSDKVEELVSIADFIGESDDDATIGFQAALSVGGDLYLPKGVYTVTEPLSIKSNTRLHGPGIVESTNQTDSVFKVINATNVIIDGITVKRALSANPGGSTLAANILVDNSQNVRINLCNAVISRIGSCVLVTNKSRDVTVAGCTVKTDSSFDPAELQTALTVASPNGIFISDSCKNILVYGNTCESIGHGIMIQNVTGNTPIYNVIVSSNNIRECSSYGIMSYRLSESVHNVSIVDNIIENVYGTYYNSATPSTPYTHGSGIYGQNVHRHVIKGNIIKNVCVNTNNFGTLSPAGIGFGSVSNFDVSDNIIIQSGSNGILIDGTDTIIANNSIRETVRAAIRSRSSSRLSITGNTIDCSSSGTQGVLLEDTASAGIHKYDKITDNSIFGSVSPISGVGLQNSLIAGNTIDSSTAASGTGISVSGSASYDTDILNNKVSMSAGYGIRCTSSGRVIGNQVKGASAGMSITQSAAVFFKDNKADTAGSGSVFVAQEITSANVITPLWLSDNIAINITGTTQVNGIYNVPIGATVTVRVPSGITLGNVVGSDGIRFRFSDGAAKTTTRTQVFQFVHLLNGILDCVSIQ